MLSGSVPAQAAGGAAGGSSLSPSAHTPGCCLQLSEREKAELQELHSDALLQGREESAETRLRQEVTATSTGTSSGTVALLHKASMLQQLEKVRALCTLPALPAAAAGK